LRRRAVFIRLRYGLQLGAAPGQQHLGVDADSLTGAVRLYERVGFTVDNTWIAYKKHLR